MKPSGFRSYEIAWRVPCRATVGTATAIADVRFSDVQAWVAELSAKRGTSIVATAYWCWRASSMTRCATGCWSAIRRAGVKLPKRPPRRNVYLSVGSCTARRRVRPVPLACAAARRRRAAVG